MPLLIVCCLYHHALTSYRWDPACCGVLDSPRSYFPAEVEGKPKEHSETSGEQARAQSRHPQRNGHDNASRDGQYGASAFPMGFSSEYSGSFRYNMSTCHCSCESVFSVTSSALCGGHDSAATRPLWRTAMIFRVLEACLSLQNGSSSFSWFRIPRTKHTSVRSVGAHHYSKSKQTIAMNST